METKYSDEELVILIQDRIRTGISVHKKVSHRKHWDLLFLYPGRIHWKVTFYLEKDMIYINFNAKKKEEILLEDIKMYPLAYGRIVWEELVNLGFMTPKEFEDEPTFHT